MPVSGLLALLDDVATLAATTAQKGATMVNDVGTLAAAAAKKTSGVVTDDMAVTAEQAIGIRREREIPVVVAVAKGSFKNKALYLTPGALLLNAVAPWAITPLLMGGGAFLAYEGVEKILPHPEEPEAAAEEPPPTDYETYEAMRVAGAIRTDLILSAEIIAITLGQVAEEPFLTGAIVLYAVSVVMTVGVYGMVGGLVKLDDFGEVLARRGGAMGRLGQVILTGAPKLLRLISVVGTAAMLMVGGQILLHGFHPLGEAVEHLLDGVPLAGLLGVAIDLLAGLIAGFAVVGVMKTGIPGKVWGAVRGMVRKA